MKNKILRTSEETKMIKEATSNLYFFKKYKEIVPKIIYENIYRVGSY